MTACGYTPAQIDDIPFPTVLDLIDYWQEYPPVHLMVRAYLGIKGSDRTAPDEKPVALSDAGPQLLATYGGEQKTMDHLPAHIQQALAERGILKFPKQEPRLP